MTELQKVTDEIEYLLDFTNLSVEDIARHVRVSTEWVKSIAERLQAEDE